MKSSKLAKYKLLQRLKGYIAFVADQEWWYIVNPRENSKLIIQFHYEHQHYSQRVTI